MSSSRKPFAAALAALFMVSSCSSSSMHQADESPALVLLYFNGCPTSNEVRMNLKVVMDAAEQSPFTYSEVDMGDLDPMDDRLRWGSPTILVDSRDLFGMPPADAPGFSCRLYDHVPSSSDIQVALAQRLNR